MLVMRSVMCAFIGEIFISWDWEHEYLKGNDRPAFSEAKTTPPLFDDLPSLATNNENSNKTECESNW